MKRIIYGASCLLSLLSLTANAQPAPASPAARSQANAPTAAAEPLQLFTSAARIAERIAQTDAALKAGGKISALSSLVSWGPFHAHMIYRNVPTATYFVNDDFAEFYVILAGAGTMTVGSTLINPVRTGPHVQSDSATGGVAHKLVKGDMLLVPPSTAHRVTAVQGKFVYMSVHMPLAPKMPPTVASAAAAGRPSGSQ